MEPVSNTSLPLSGPATPGRPATDATASTPSRFIRPGLFGLLARRACYRWQSRLPTRHISHRGAPYLERSYVATVFGIRIYLHRFVACDEDGLHDHPFRHSLSLILAGWYWEDLWAGRGRRRWFNYIGPNKLHRVVLPEAAGADVWTLFFHTPRVKAWGILQPVASDVGTGAPEPSSAASRGCAEGQEDREGQEAKAEEAGGARDDGLVGGRDTAMRFEIQSSPDDPALSSWHRTAPTGRELRLDPTRNVDGAPAFDIPLGMNAYSAGLAHYPESARRG